MMFNRFWCLLLVWLALVTVGAPATAWAQAAASQTAASDPASTQATTPAQSPTPSARAPLPLSQQQFDALVDALSKSVAERLGTSAPATSAPSPHIPAASTPATSTSSTAASTPETPMMEMTDEEPFSEVFIEIIERGDDVLAQFPGLIEQSARIPHLLGPGMNEGRERGTFLLLLLGCVIVLLGAEALMRLALKPVREYLGSRVEGAASIWALSALVGIDIVMLSALWLVTHGLVIGLFDGTLPQSRLGFLVLTSVFYWRLYLLVFHITLRPGLPPARLAMINDHEARTIYRWASLVIAVAIILADFRRILDAIQSSPLVVACAIVINTILLTSLLLTTVVVVRKPVAKWLHGLSQDGQPGPLVTMLARWWLVVAVPAFLALGLARIYGTLTTWDGIHTAILLTMNVLIGLFALESFMDKVCRLMRADPDTEKGSREAAIEAIMRCVRMAILLVSLALLVRIWLVHGVGMMEMSRYDAIARAALPSGAILLAAYCAWQGVEYFTGLHPGRSAAAAPGADVEEGHHGPRSRMTTLMPLLRVTLMLAIIILAGLTVLGQLGIDVTPLIAGASIIGLAISFGSQTLVKDIVSGVFYLVDDAFRVGEYIDCGKAKGTVEGFTLRSLKLRHQNGMIHTIPFGQLGQVTNFSRDWTTMKFNLRFTRNTDLEQLRKAVKKIGAEMLEDPELKDEFLTQLKMQGVADIADNALVVRFKFTVRPVKPTVVRREAIKRMVNQLPQQGIQFANNMVPVQSMSGDAAADQGAAAAVTRARIANDLARQAEEEAAAS
ncbi:mechanosensitive ion channel family protein [Ancylobacter pratisalsi]|uniref:Mechanosensitive ion channel family protein n=1 Tax=Ancylobacter pratisalsi TaxID=1745854 RepID=A0A6P1YP61_9HYPH|nr:mechanosensitive ion channel family protein [Ancylobacter pratisalsi]QIB35159.1 mechanosensitive ion channel family protein [Ancylobacter pratisalsi]